MKLVSFIMPTRTASAEMFLESVSSIRRTAKFPQDIEILLRIDDDDLVRRSMAETMQRFHPVKLVVGPRGSGYDNMGTFVDDLVKVANSRWCWLFDDDAWVEGDWSGLYDIRCDILRGPAVNSEFYCLGESHYNNGPTGGAVGLIMPTGFVKKLAHKAPVDQQWLEEVVRMGWTVQQLKGVSYHHDGRRR